MFFRRKNTGGSGRRQAELVLRGSWTSELYGRGPVRVPAHPDVDAFLAQRPMPSVRPGDDGFAKYVNGNDDLMRAMWCYVLLHHPDSAVRGACLRSPRLVTGFALIPDRVADLLLDEEVAQDAAATVWRLSETGLRIVLNVVLSRGLVASGFTAEQTKSALILLRRTCPPDRLAALEAGPAAEQEDTSLDVFGTASRLVDLSAAVEREYDALDERQRDLRRDWQYLDRLASSGEAPEAALAGPVAIRRIGHRLNGTGGIALMREVAACAGDLSAQRMAERDLNRRWDRIGDWMA
ncbi:hypothetical protein SAMN04489732_12444 [Amycolatopsis saalfeldensis]|uniref:Uncharacterized protein n=2 Tax=Amycolatopsis saalfeldensis TaxID=394193 RepID=A0A1H8YLX8_9PSEU|nr:hypothetical protein SAMN04489732_12444 [Amycolatopsis saalfeldensis]